MCRNLVLNSALLFTATKLKVSLALCAGAANVYVC